MSISAFKAHNTKSFFWKNKNKETIYSLRNPNQVNKVSFMLPEI